jgi:LmbE family N-acetylglucosaminyl deacetylase
MPDIALYLQRVNFVLRQGAPINDVALYLPRSDAWAHVFPGHVNLIETLRDQIGPNVIPQVLDAGFGFDVVDDDALEAAKPYRAIILPGVERMPPETLQRLEEFARSGGVLIATRRLPARAPGFTATPADHAQIDEIARRLFEAPGSPGRFVRNEEAELGTTLRRVLRPDVVMSPAAPDIGFAHRRTNEADIYFVANTGNVRQAVTATFRVESAGAESWDPMTGRILPQPAERSTDGVAASLDLEPYASRVIVFPKEARLQPDATTKAQATMGATIDLSAGWKVTFQPGGPAVVMDRLRSWTDDEATRYFSGVATYENEVVVPDAMIARGRRVRLDFGDGQAVPPQRLPSGMQAWLDAPIREARWSTSTIGARDRCGARRIRSTSPMFSPAAPTGSASLSPTSPSTRWPGRRCPIIAC